MRSYPTAVLFDLDNTLVPFLGPLNRWARAWADEAAPSGAREQVASALVSATLDGPEDPERGVAHVLERFDLGEVAEPASAAAERAYAEAVEPYPGVCGLLGELWRSDRSLGVVTDAPRQRAMLRLEGAGLARLFDVIVTRDETPRGKRGPEPFDLALGVLDAEPSQAAMIGDWPAFDVAWPQRLGMQAVLAGWGVDPDDPRASDGTPPCPVAGHPSEVPDLLADGRPDRGRHTPASTPTSGQAALTAF